MDNETVTEEREGTSPLIVEVWHDPDTESPNDYETNYLQLVSFISRHIDSMDPDTVFACDECGESADTWQHRDVAAYETEYGAIGNSGEREDVESELHEFIPSHNVAAILNYYEHGLCRWYVAPSASPVDMQWDGVYGAGVLLVRDEHRDEWDTLTDAQRSEVMESMVDEYTDWSNGSTFGYTIEREVIGCPCCGSTDRETLDSCGGFIGADYIRSVILESLASELGKSADELQVGTDYVLEGEHAYAIDL